MANVLCTGAAGFIGSHLCRRLLKEGHVVIGMDDLSVGFRENLKDEFFNPNFSFFENDIREMCKFDDNVKLQNIDVVYHLAARGELYYCEEQPEQAISVNVEGTVAVLNWAKKNNVKRFMFADTSAEYDNTPTETIEQWGSEITDPDVYPPKGIYSISKNAASRFVRLFFPDNHVIFRFFNVYGASMNTSRDIPPVIGAFIAGIRDSGTVTIYGDGEKRRDFIYIDDLLHMLLAVLDDDKFEKIKGGTFNAGTEKNHSINDILEFVQTAMSATAIRIVKPNMDYQADITLANMEDEKELFEIEEFISLEDGIKRTVESYYK